jgi:uncharacterized repeat protein (TIGR01451 family)
MRKRQFFVILPLALVLMLIPLLVSAAGGPWSDNFDSYATGSQLHGVGGWLGWGDVPAAGAMTSSAQARSAPNSVDILGGSDLIQQYTTASGQWVFTAWQYIPGNMTGTTYFIMLNRYDHACADCNWSVQVQFDSTSGMMFDDGASGSSQAFLTDQWVEIRVEIDLDADTHSFYYNGALFYSGTWTTHQTGVGSLAIANVDLYANNATSVYYDDMSLVENVPDLAVRKSPDTQDVTTGGNAQFTIDITNTGTVTWDNVTATDALVPACDNATTALAPGDSFSYTCTDVGVAASYTNTVVVVGDVTGGPTITVMDSAAVNVNAPTSVSLSGFGSDNAGVPTGLVVVSIGAVLAAGAFIVSRRRQQI